MHMVCQEHESAYWDGSKGVCCDGNVYQPDIEDTSYACCPTGKEVSIVQGKENLNHCCSEGQKAYWNGSSAQCCATATHQIVTNYISGQTDTVYACCETKEDIQTTTSEYDGLVTYIRSNGNWKIAGAVNGKCCSGYTTSGYQEYRSDSGESVLMGDCSDMTDYAVNENGSVYYCAFNVHVTGWGNGCGWSNATWGHVSSSKYCFTDIGNDSPPSCTCSETGDPQYGDPC